MVQTLAPLATKWASYLTSSPLYSSIHITASLLGLIVIYAAYNFFLHPLSRISGPLSARLGFPYFRVSATTRQTYAWEHYKMHEKYGSTVRLGPNFVSSVDESVLREVYYRQGNTGKGGNSGHNFHKTGFYTAFASIPSAPSLFSDTNSERHDLRRRSVASVYSMKKMVDLEVFVDTTVGQLVERIDREIEAQSPAQDRTAYILINECMGFFAGDAVGELAFGESFGFLSSGDPNHILLSSRNLSVFGAIAGSTEFPRLGSLIKSLLWRTTSSTPAIIAPQSVRRVESRYKAIENGEVYDETGVPKRRDMLSGFIECKDPKTKEKLGFGDVVSQCTSVFGAGSDTTAVALDAFFYFVLRHPSVYQQLQSEIDAAFENGTLSYPVRYADGTKLEYLQACLKESMRLFPSIGMDLPRRVPKGGMMASNYFLPEGTNIAVSAFSYHRTEVAFGEDAKEFRPERWVGLSDEERVRLERNNLVFGAGSRICIGKNISLMEMTKVLPTLLRKYHFAIPSRRSNTNIQYKYNTGRSIYGEESLDEPCWCNSTWFTEMEDFWCQVQPRGI